MDSEPSSAIQKQPRDVSQQQRTGLGTLVFTDIVGSTELKHQLGDRAAAALFQKHDEVIRRTLAQFVDAREIEVAGDSFLLVFTTPSSAVKFALMIQPCLRALSSQVERLVQVRVGIHVGEVLLQDADTRVKGGRDLFGIQVDTCARLMSLAKGGQVLMTRAAFDSARQVLKGEDIEGVGALSWLSHGPYKFKGIEVPVEVCEVGESDRAPLNPPTSSEKAQRQVRADEEEVLGWRPAVGQMVPNTKWLLEEKLGEGGFGEVWLGQHQLMKKRRVFKFCFHAERVRFLKREMTLFRLLKERAGDHPNIVALQEVSFDAPPYYVEMDYVEGKDLRTWCQARGRGPGIPLEMRLEIIAQAAEALQAAHDAGIIHRDIKPSNILIEDCGSRIADRQSEEWDAVHGKYRWSSPQPAIRNLPSAIQVKLTDFGIGQVVSQEALAGMTKLGFTQTMMSPGSSSQTGTQLYMAPELFAGSLASTRSNIYSLGVVLYQLVLWDFTHPVTMDWAEQISDPLLRDDLKHCFAGNPNDRFAGAGQLARNLRALPARRAELAQRELERQALERAAYRRGMLRTAGVAAVIVAVIACLAVLAFNQSRRAKSEAAKAAQSAQAEKEQRHEAESRRREARRVLYAADMNLVQQALKVSNLGRARDLLYRNVPREGEEGLRGWEWRYFWQFCQTDELLTFLNYTNSIYKLAMSLDGKRLAVSTSLGSVDVWSLPEGNKIQELQSGGQYAVAAFSPDGNQLAVADQRNKITLWDTAAWKPQTNLNQAGPVRSIHFAPSGTRLVSFGREGVLRVWDVVPPYGNRQLKVSGNSSVHHGDAVFSSDGTRIAVGLPSGIVRILDAESLAVLREFKHPLEGITALAFSRDGRFVATGSGYASYAIHIWDAETAALVKTLDGHRGWVSKVAFSPDGRLLASTSADQTIRMWDASSWEHLTTFQGHTLEVWAMAFLPTARAYSRAAKMARSKSGILQRALAFPHSKVFWELTSSSRRH